MYSRIQSLQTEEPLITLYAVTCCSSPQTEQLKVAISTILIEMRGTVWSASCL